MVTMSLWSCGKVCSTVENLGEIGEMIVQFQAKKEAIISLLWNTETAISRPSQGGYL